MRLIRIFISSPGDVREERERARQVVESLRRRYAGRLDLRPSALGGFTAPGGYVFSTGIDQIRPLAA
ncbi:MAG: hypothetical protein P1V20_05970 [Verrucomicrobiales bacterium]|nr:hypothetical protein [Verrucomicrobiales bacterium]